MKEEKSAANAQAHENEQASADRPTQPDYPNSPAGQSSVKASAPENTDKPLRHGYTTGSCATAATKASLLALCTGAPVNEVEILLPIGERVTFQIVQQERGDDWVESGIIKDGGDDPDATHGALILSRVAWQEQPGFVLDGGIGVGRVTKPGLAVAVGEAAINPVPRKMITEVVDEVLRDQEIDCLEPNHGVSVIISVPDGEQIAKKTLNERLGILGGISILGTRGIVVPFSTAAYKASVAQAIKVAKAGGCQALALTTGGRSEKKAMELYPDWPEEAFIQMGDFVGFSAMIGKKQGFHRMTVVGMMGKLSKVAQGVMMVHSKSAPVDFGFLARVAAESGADEELQEQIRTANTASHAGDLMMAAGLHSFFDRLAIYCGKEIYNHVGKDVEIETILTTLQGEILGRAVYDGNEDTGNRDRDRG
ncbi:cobalt-precorrin-5B (C(1))-methyltransferase [Brevibacillus dissolubilis]|uniref:cobalt-precorrin-5B (C(1))-methyltransferase n=1 Tax=Brevibacillus dissolubilis TaxID=1844116 RepID=UPI00111762F0|nr:cobalt-precorrin-5B (C(1))-methyltransferase [Brevibacillus dissolubilis]